MNKTKKILIIIIVSLAITLCITAGVFYGLWPAETKGFIMNAWEWLNNPLPVFGVSALVLGVFAIKLLSMSSFGKRNLNQIKQNFENLKAENEQLKNDISVLLENQSKIISDTKEDIKKTSEFVYKITKAIPNKKVKEIGDNFYGKEKANN